MIAIGRVLSSRGRLVFLGKCVPRVVSPRVHLLYLPIEWDWMRCMHDGTSKYLTKRTLILVTVYQFQSTYFHRENDETSLGYYRPRGLSSHFEAVFATKFHGGEIFSFLVQPARSFGFAWLSTRRELIRRNKLRTRVSTETRQIHQLSGRRVARFNAAREFEMRSIPHSCSYNKTGAHWHGAKKTVNIDASLYHRSLSCDLTHRPINYFRTTSIFAFS